MVIIKINTVESLLLKFRIIIRKQYLAIPVFWHMLYHLTEAV